ncbi:MAG: Gfo/Idh/MocA family oxidoreductase [Actinomycetia bacterium]|nr:Gfo/Idh/MocA family oxidoreductase [Actinomycetes bacterium]
MALSVGLVGAGPWAHAFHAPMIAAGPETVLSAVWARRPEAAKELAGAFSHPPAGSGSRVGEGSDPGSGSRTGPEPQPDAESRPGPEPRSGSGGPVQVAPSFDALLDACDAVVFAVPPDVQAHYAPLAAAAGKALLLEKPLGLTLAQAEAVAAAVAEAGVVSQLMLTYRFMRPIRAFLDQAAVAGAPIGAVAAYVSGAARPGAYFATPWRVANGALLDLGPHVLDLLDAAVGPIVAVRGAAGDPRRWFAATVEHDNGALSQVTLSLTTPVDPEVFTVRLYTASGELVLENVGETDDVAHQSAIRATFAEAVAAGRSPALNADRGLYLQRIIDQAARAAAG